MHKGQFHKDNHVLVFFGTFGLKGHLCFFCGDPVQVFDWTSESNKPCIHHRDGNRKNNRPSNLKIAHHGCHTSHHNKRRPGPFSGKTHRSESRAAISTALIGNKYAVGNTNMRGKKHTEESKQKMRLAKQR